MQFQWSCQSIWPVCFNNCTSNAVEDNLFHSRKSGTWFALLLSKQDEIVLCRSSSAAKSDELLASLLRLLVFLRPLVFSHFPGLVGVKGIHPLEGLHRVRSKILFVNDAVSSDHECLHSGHAIFCRRGRKAEPADHRASDHEIYFTPRRSRTLLLQHFEIVTVIRLTLIAVALLQGLGDFLANRTAPGSIRIFPR